MIIIFNLIIFYLNRAVTQADYKVLEQMANKAIKDKIPFERCVLTKAQLLELFKVNINKYKLLFKDNKLRKNNIKLTI